MYVCMYVRMYVRMYVYMYAEYISSWSMLSNNLGTDNLAHDVLWKVAILYSGSEETIQMA